MRAQIQIPPMLPLVMLLWLGMTGVVLPNDALPEQSFPANPDMVPAVRAWNSQYKTLDAYLQAAENGESKAQYYVADMYLRGDGVEQDIPRAVGWLKKAAHAGEPRAEYTLGILHMSGTGVPRDLDAARTWLRLAATWNLPEARDALAELDRIQRHGATGDLLARAQGGEAAAQYRIARNLMAGESPTPNDLEQARAWLERAAANHHPESAYELAIAYRDGVGGARDIERAKTWFQRASQVGVLRARIALADLAGSDTSPVAQVVAPAIMPSTAARGGDAQAQFELGRKYLTGDGVARDTALAHEWLAKAANQNHRPAQLALADALARGIDFEQNYDEAAKWYLRAAQGGDAEAQFVMGTLYSVGLGVNANATESTRWYEAAAKQGNSKAQQRLSATPN